MNKKINKQCWEHCRLRVNNSTWHDMTWRHEAPPPCDGGTMRSPFRCQASLYWQKTLFTFSNQAVLRALPTESKQHHVYMWHDITWHRPPHGHSKMLLPSGIVGTVLPRWDISAQVLHSRPQSHPCNRGCFSLVFIVLLVTDALYDNWCNWAIYTYDGCAPDSQYRIICVSNFF